MLDGGKGSSVDPVKPLPNDFRCLLIINLCNYMKPFFFVMHTCCKIYLGFLQDFLFTYYMYMLCDNYNSTY